MLVPSSVVHCQVYRPLMSTDVVPLVDGMAFPEDLLPGILQNTTGREQWVSRATPFNKIVIAIDTPYI